MEKAISNEHHEWVAHLFQKLLGVLAELGLREEAPDIFLVYAHDNERLQKDADADVAHQLIGWLESV